MTGPPRKYLMLANHLGAPTAEENISAALEGMGCYRWRDEAIRMVVPEYEPDWKHKIVRSAPTGSSIMNIYWKQYMWLKDQSPYITRQGNPANPDSQWLIEPQNSGQVR